MIKHIVCLFFICVTVFFLSACNNEDNSDLSDIAIIIKPSLSDSINIQSGDKQLFSMQYYVNTGGRVNRLQIKSVDVENGEMILLDTTYTETVKEATYLYVAPQSIKESLRIRLTFTLWETNGIKTQQTRYVNVTNKQLMMQELGPIVLFMATDKVDGIMFNAPTQVFDHVLENATRKADMYLGVDTLNAGTYSLSLQSGTQARFVRVNSFDYASATSVAIQTVYASSVRIAKVDELQTNDIVIVGHGVQVEGIIFIQNIVRHGIDNDLCVQFRFKPVYRLTTETQNSISKSNGI